MPLLPFLDESQSVAVLPALLRLDKGDLTEALAALAHAEPPPLAPRALLLQLHLLKPEDGERGVPLKALIDAVQAGNPPPTLRPPPLPQLITQISSIDSP